MYKQCESQIETLRCLNSDDGSFKYILQLSDGNQIETVFIPEQQNTAKICISNQIGCFNKCAYCATGMLHYIRDMSANEIVGQLHHVLNNHLMNNLSLNDLGVLFMGMGEPFFNYENVVLAIRAIEKIDFSTPIKTNVIVSTSGIVPGIIRFSDEHVSARLAVSINPPNDLLRSSIMPINKIYPLQDVLSACQYYTSTTQNRIIIEYILLADFNDDIEHAAELTDKLAHLPCEIQLIPFNSFRQARYTTPSESDIKKFKSVLEAKGFHVSLKPSYGQDILGGCGQLGGEQ